MMPPAEPGSISAGEAGGIFAGIVTLLGLIGGGIAWCAGWFDRRAQSRSAKLDTWAKELGEREATLDSAMKAELAELKRELGQIPGLIKEQSDMRTHLERYRIAFRIVASELAKVAPSSPALIYAQSILAEMFYAPTVTDEQVALADKIE